MTEQKSINWFLRHTRDFLVWERYMERRCTAAKQLRGPVVQRLADAAYCLDAPD